VPEVPQSVSDKELATRSAPGASEPALCSPSAAPLGLEDSGLTGFDLALAKAFLELRRRSLDALGRRKALSLSLAGGYLHRHSNYSPSSGGVNAFIVEMGG
jgi:hypothetical protein